MSWINVKDKLPEKYEKVLFYCFHDNKINRIYMGYLCEKGWNIYLPYMSFPLNNEANEITHWMHLPDFPKEKIK